MTQFIMDLLDVQSSETVQQFSIINHHEFVCPHHCKFCHRFLITDDRYNILNEETYFQTGLARLEAEPSEKLFEIIIDLQLSYIDNEKDYLKIFNKLNSIYDTRNRKFKKVSLYIAVDLMAEKSYKTIQNFLNYMKKSQYEILFPSLSIHFYCSFDLWGRFDNKRFDIFCNNLKNLRKFVKAFHNVFANTFAMIFMPGNIERLLDDVYISPEKTKLLEEIENGTNIYFSKPKEIANEEGITAEFLTEYREGITLDICKSFFERYSKYFDRQLTPEIMYKLLNMKENYNENASVFTLDKL